LGSKISPAVAIVWEGSPKTANLPLISQKIVIPCEIKIFLEWNRAIALEFRAQTSQIIA
jgi:hypothetical protein